MLHAELIYIDNFIQRMNKSFFIFCHEGNAHKPCLFFVLMPCLYVPDLYIMVRSSGQALAWYILKD